MSAIFRDSNRHPTEIAADWLEYVIRHNGTNHLRSSALDLNIFQYLLLDIICISFVGFITFITISILWFRFCWQICRKVCSSVMDTRPTIGSLDKRQRFTKQMVNKVKNVIFLLCCFAFCFLIYSAGRIWMNCWTHHPLSGGCRRIQRLKY